ncbi:hypothetical protein [uncultured Treponema sp.]|uniref:hypothetical protein n=1 Tax=uncultured Treponema sp. TaxID=162155 RepID=UPI0025FDD892|nr:hypothetical protein [uncultured Treponema sp.]
MLKIVFNASGNFFKKGILILASISLFSFSACKKDHKLTASNSIPAEAVGTGPEKLKRISPETKAWLEGKNIVVVLGYGYNDEESINKITQSLNDNFGVETEEKEDLVSVFVYPNDFMVAGKERISSLVDRIEDKTLAGMIILGAPDGMHIALSKIQDKSEDGKVNYPVFTLFSQDDVLGSESTSDFVLDYAHKTNTIDGEVTDFIPDFDATEILTNSISAMIELREPLKADSNLLNFVQKLLGKNRTVVHFVDGETGLQSINHFIFE